jgi:hypothetical protein
LLIVLALGGLIASGCGGRSTSEPDSIPAEPDDGSSLEDAITAQDSTPPIITSPPERTPEAPTRLTGQTIRVAGGDGSGIQGSFYMEKSPLGTTLSVVEASGRICVRGQQVPVPEGDYPNYWGAEVGLALVSSLTSQGLAAEALSVAGFAFRFEGALPPVVRFRVGAAGEVPLYSQYCQHVPLDTGARIEVKLEELIYECWNAEGRPFPDAAGATLLAWQIPANETTSGAFDFCIEAIETLP